MIAIVPLKQRRKQSKQAKNYLHYLQLIFLVIISDWIIRLIYFKNVFSEHF